MSFMGSIPTPAVSAGADYLPLVGGAKLYPPFKMMNGFRLTQTRSGQYMARKGDAVVYGATVMDAYNAAVRAGRDMTPVTLEVPEECEGLTKPCTCVRGQHNTWARMVIAGVASGQRVARPDPYCTYCRGSGVIL